MNTGKIEIIYGEGSGRTAMALGKGLEALSRHKKVIVIQFLKGNQKEESLKVMRRLEPDMNLFSLKRPAASLMSFRNRRSRRSALISAMV